MDLNWEPSPRKNPAGRRRIVVGGIDLQNAAIDQIWGFPLCRSYSAKQIRTISRHRLRKVKYGHANHKSSNPQFIRHVTPWKSSTSWRCRNVMASDSGVTQNYAAMMRDGHVSVLYPRRSGI
jgi:hypothetical protein